MQVRDCGGGSERERGVYVLVPMQHTTTVENLCPVIEFGYGICGKMEMERKTDFKKLKIKKTKR